MTVNDNREQFASLSWGQGNPQWRRTSSEGREYENATPASDKWGRTLVNSRW